MEHVEPEIDPYMPRHGQMMRMVMDARKSSTIRDPDEAGDIDLLEYEVLVPCRNFL